MWWGPMVARQDNFRIDTTELWEEEVHNMRRVEWAYSTEYTKCGGIVLWFMALYLCGEIHSYVNYSETQNGQHMSPNVKLV